jgi:hypothetical protein
MMHNELIHKWLTFSFRVIVTASWKDFGSSDMLIHRRRDSNLLWVVVRRGFVPQQWLSAMYWQAVPKSGEMVPPR